MSGNRIILFWQFLKCPVQVYLAYISLFKIRISYHRIYQASGNRIVWFGSANFDLSGPTLGCEDYHKWSYSGFDCKKLPRNSSIRISSNQITLFRKIVRSIPRPWGVGWMIIDISYPDFIDRNSSNRISRVSGNRMILVRWKPRPWGVGGMIINVSTLRLYRWVCVCLH